MAMNNLTSVQLSNSPLKLPTPCGNEFRKLIVCWATHHLYLSALKLLLSSRMATSSNIMGEERKVTPAHFLTGIILNISIISFFSCLFPNKKAQCFSHERRNVFRLSTKIKRPKLNVMMVIKKFLVMWFYTCPVPYLNQQLPCIVTMAIVSSPDGYHSTTARVAKSLISQVKRNNNTRHIQNRIGKFSCLSMYCIFKLGRKS